MVKSCCVWGCSTRYRKGTGLRFFRFPKSGPQRALWIRRVNRRKCESNPKDPSTSQHNLDPSCGDGFANSNPRSSLWIPGKWDVVCARHFISGTSNADKSHPDYAPSQYMKPADFKNSPRSTSKKNCSVIDRYERTERRRNLFNTSMTSLPSEGTSTSDEHDEIGDSVVNQEMEPGQCKTCDDLHNENHRLTTENAKLSKEVDSLRKERDQLQGRLQKVHFSPEYLSDKHLKFYTGLPSFASFMWLFGIVSTFLTERRVLSKENQLFITLVKLRQGLQNHDLAFRFGVSLSTISDVISDCIPVLAERLQFLIQWPTKEILLRNMPDSFKKRFNKCCIIIDCTEFFIERPYNLKTRAKTWSNYKHHHTLKGLIGITPYGSISFVSKLWGGRISDKEITQKSGFYDKIMYGDQVMADRGFTIVNELARRGATLVIPPFIKGRKQLPGGVVQRARQLSHLRIHVERAMERIKNYKILKNTFPLTLVPHASDILTICGALTNLSPRLIK